MRSVGDVGKVGEREHVDNRRAEVRAGADVGGFTMLGRRGSSSKW